MTTHTKLTLSFFIALALSGCSVDKDSNENGNIEVEPDTPLVIENLGRLQNAPLNHQTNEGYTFDHINAGITMPSGTTATLCLQTDATCSNGVEIHPNPTPIKQGAFEIAKTEYKVVYSNPAYNNDVTSDPFYFSTEEINKSIQQVSASNADIGDFFGWATAISGDGKTMVVAAKMEDSASNTNDDLEHDNSATNTGALYVFELVDGNWQQSAYLKKWFSGNSDELGFSVAINFDGTIIASGAPWDDSSATGINSNTNDDTMSQAGAVYIFEKTEAGWIQSAYAKSSATAAGQMLGIDIDISDNDVIVAGAKGDANKKGAAIIFSKSSGQWKEDSILYASHGDSNDEFGDKVAISGDGQTIIVGAPKESSATKVESDADNSSPSSGAAYIFEKTSSWSQTHYIKSDFIDSGDLFGYNVCINHDGTSYAVTSRDHSIGSSFNGDGSIDGLEDSGSVTVYRNDTPLHFLKSPSPAQNARFGLSCAFNGLGDVLAVSERSSFTGDGYYVDYSSVLGFTGSVSVFDLEKRTVNTVMSTQQEENTAGYFRDTDITQDGSTIVVAEYEELDDTGRVYTYNVK